MKGIKDSSTVNFSTLISGTDKFIVPKFQRDYSWDYEQWDDLWQDIEIMLNMKDEHYMGYLVLQTNNNKDYQIIDGQQRFTTLTFLIIATIKAIKHLAEQGIDAENNNQRVQTLINTYIGKVDPVTLDYNNKLVLNRNNDSYYRDYIVKMGNLVTRNTKATEKLMKRCFEFFETKLKDKFATGQEYANYITNVIDNLHFTRILVTDELNAFKVFETLNARGVQLSSADLLKNYLFSIIDANKAHPERINSLEEKWAKITNNVKSDHVSEFMRYYWNMSHKSVSKKAIFKTIKENITNEESVFNLINDMIPFSEIYMSLRDGNDPLWDDSEVREMIEVLNLFRLKQPISVLMAAKQKLDSNNFKKALKTILNLCFRYNVICDKNPNDQEAPFNMLAMDISNTATLHLDLLKSIYVDDDSFKSGFEEFAIQYNSNNAKKIRYILGKIEHFKGGVANVTINDEDASIEHILPQNYGEEWNIDDEVASRCIDKLGNLCLLERTRNRTIGNIPYDDKKQYYKDSMYHTTSNIPDEYNEWTEAAISRRQKKLSKDAIGVWRIDFK